MKKWNKTISEKSNSTSTEIADDSEVFVLLAESSSFPATRKLMATQKAVPNLSRSSSSFDKSQSSEIIDIYDLAFPNVSPIDRTSKSEKSYFAEKQSMRQQLNEADSIVQSINALQRVSLLSFFFLSRRSDCVNKATHSTRNSSEWNSICSFSHWKPINCRIDWCLYFDIFSSVLNAENSSESNYRRVILIAIFTRSRTSFKLID